MPKWTNTKQSATITVDVKGHVLGAWLYRMAFQTGYYFGKMFPHAEPLPDRCAGAFEKVLDHVGRPIVWCPDCQFNYFLPGGVTAEEVCLVLQTLNSTTHHV